MNRPQFFTASSAFGAVALGAPAAADQQSLAQSSAAASASPAPAPAPTAAPARRLASTFFRDADMNFVFLNTLGPAYYGIGDVGTALAIADQIEDGNPASAFAVLSAYGARFNAAADAALAHRHRVTARETYLQASNYLFAATYFCDGAGTAEQLAPTWARSRAALDAAFALYDHPVEHVAIPYQGTTLPGYFFKADNSATPRPLLILNNGSDGSVLDMWVMSGAASLARGYNCLAFDGPGQGAALWRQHLVFRPDWEKVITPVVDFAIRRKDVDPKRIALQGISQGGYWVPRAAAFEHRLRAAIVDPGVMDVSTSWLATLPPPILQLLKTGQKATFDRIMASTPASLRATLAFRSRPFGMASPFDVYTAVQKYSLAGVADKIRCPVLVTNPENEQFWPGQSKQLYDALRTKRTLMNFSAADGANWHCEPMAPGLRSRLILDWLDETLAHG